MKPEKGQILYSLNVGNAARNREKVLTEVVVVKVGRKYFYAAPLDRVDDEYLWVQYSIKTWLENTDYTACSALYKSKQEYTDKKKKDELMRKIEKLFRGYSNPELSLDQLIKIDEIINP